MRKLKDKSITSRLGSFDSQSGNEPLNPQAPRARTRRLSRPTKFTSPSLGSVSPLKFIESVNVVRFLQSLKIVKAAVMLVRLFCERERKDRDGKETKLGRICPVRWLEASRIAVSLWQLKRLSGKAPLNRLLPKSTVLRRTSLEKS